MLLIIYGLRSFRALDETMAQALSFWEEAII